MGSNVWVSKPYRESYQWLLESMPPLLARTKAFSSGTITQSERQSLSAIGDKQEHNEKLLTFLERNQENYPCLVDVVTETGCEEVAERLREALPPPSPQSQPGLLQGPPPQLEAQSQSKPLPLRKRLRLPTLHRLAKLRRRRMLRFLAKLHRRPMLSFMAELLRRLMLRFLAKPRRPPKQRRLPKQPRLPKQRRLPKPRCLPKQRRLPKPRHLPKPHHLPKPRRLPKPRCLPMSPILPDKPLEPEVEYQPYVYPLDTLANGEAAAEANNLQADARHLPQVFKASPSSSDAGIDSDVDEGLYAGSSGSLSRAPLAERSNNRPVVSNIGDGISTTVSRRGGGHSLNLKVIGSIVKSVQAHCEAKPFAQPVSLKDVPDYLEFVEEPMDFGTIRSRLTHMDYHYVETVLKDVHLVFHNCYIYSDESTDTYKSGLELERYFLQLLKTQLKDYVPRYTIALV